LETRLRYADYHNISIVSGALTKFTYAWNSTYDPNQSGGGHQPLYRDVFAGIYDHYSVVRARAIVRVINPGTTSVLVGCVTDDDTTSSSTFQTLMEQSHGTTQHLTPVSGSKSEAVFNLSWDCIKVLGIDPYSSESYKTAVGSDPTEMSTLVVWAIPDDGSTTVTLNATIELVQEVLWTELTTPTQS
jgi:hypothetical protein